LTEDRSFGVIHKKAGRALKRSAKGKAHGVKLKAESSRAMENDSHLKA
jgi:hypothetical protein